MKRTTLFVPEELERDLHLYANRDGRPTASLVREALTEYVARRRGEHPLPSFAARFESGHQDTAGRHDELLFKTLDPHGEPNPSQDSPRQAPRARRPAAGRAARPSASRTRGRRR
jgi:hypothetical protein